MITTAFTPIASAVGGALIGLSAVLLMSLTGRIAGVSGIAARLFPPYQDNEFTGRVAFLAGLVAAPVVVLGSVWGNGCTSGHGVCGLSRLSMRSLVATIIFMASGIATVFVARHLV